MTFKRILTLASILSVLAFAPAFAQEAPKEDGPEGKGGGRFEKVDTNGDGFVTKEEMLTAHRDRIDKMFVKLDTDKDGKLSKEELKKGHEEMRSKWKDRIGERREGKKSVE